MSIIFSVPAPSVKEQSPNLYLFAGLQSFEGFSYMRCGYITTFAVGPTQAVWFVVHWEGATEDHSVDGPLAACVFASILEARAYMEKFVEYWAMTYGVALAKRNRRLLGLPVE
jgi:hypothetical protein